MTASVSTRAQQFRDLAESGDDQGFEDLWLEALDTAPAEVSAFLDGVDALESRGLFEKAGLYLSMLTPVLLERELYAEALQVLRRIAAVAPRERGLRHGLLTAYRNLNADHPRLESLLELAGITEGKDLKECVSRMDNYLGFKVGRYVFHPGGWNAGRVVEVDPEDASLVIDFEGKSGHRMSLDMAAKKTEFIADDDLRAMKLDRAETLQGMVEEDPVELIRCAVRSRRGKASLRDLRDRITTGDAPIIPTKSWSRWWQKTRSQIKAATDITITPGANPTLELGEQTGGYADACLRDLRHIALGARRVRYFRDLMKEAPAHDDGEEALSRTAAFLVDEAAELGTGPRISLAFLLAEASPKWPTITIPNHLTVTQVLADEAATVKALPTVPIAAHRVSAVIEMSKREELDWPAFCCDVISGGAPEAADHCLHELIRNGATEQLTRTVDTLVERYRDYPRAFMWYLRSMRSGKLPESVRQEGPAQLLEKALVLHSHLDVAGIDTEVESAERQLAKDVARVFPLREYAIVREAFTHASDSEAQTLAALLRNNRSLNADLRDRALAHMFRVRPESAKWGAFAQDTVTNPLFDPSVLYTTERALATKQREYEDVVNRQIPDNSAEIGRAASYGDLSENAEWAAAVEKQGQLTQIAEELRDGISKARIIELDSENESSRIGLGSRVVIRDTEGKDHPYTVLGPWDVNADRGFISYQSPLGRALIGGTQGDTVTLEVPAGAIEYRVIDVADGLQAAEAPAS